MTNSWKKRLFAAFVALSMMVGDLPASFIADSGRVYAEEKPEAVQTEAQPQESSEPAAEAAPVAVLAAENDTQEKEIPDAPLQVMEAGTTAENAAAPVNQETVLALQENAAPEVLLQGAAGDASVIPEEQQPASDLPQETVPEATEVQSSSELPQEPAAETVETQASTPGMPEETPEEEKQTEVDSEKTPESDPSAADGETPEAPTNPETINGPEVPQEQVSDEPAAVTEPAATEPEEKQDNQETEKTAGAEAGNETPSETAVQEQQPEGENPPQPTGNDGANQPPENHPDQPQQPNNGESAGGETAPTGGQSEPQIPVIPMDAEMEVGDEEKVSVSITGAMVRLKVSKKDTLIMTATGMEAWVDIVKEGEKKSERYMPENGELTVRFEVTPGSYIMTFAPVKASDEGKLTIRVRTEAEVLAELLGEGQEAETDEEEASAGEVPGTAGEAPAGEGAGEVGAAGSVDAAGEGDLNGADEEAGEAGQDELTGEAGDAPQNGEGSEGTDETGDAPQNGEDSEGELNGETGAAPENGEAGEGTDETGDKSGGDDGEVNPQGDESVSFDEALAALEGEESEEEKTPADNAETWQAADEDAGDITFIDNAEQPAPAAQEKPEGEENAAQDVEPKDGQSEEPISPDELNPDQEATPSDSEADGETQPETQKTPEITEVDGDDLNISAYSAEQADAMALALGLKPRLMMKNAGLRQKNTLSAKPEEASETESGEKAEPETATETGFAAFDISLKDDAETATAGTWRVHVNLSEPVVLPQKENMEITGVSYELYHIPSDSGYPTRVEAEFHDSREEGLLYGFTFETDGFSDYLLKYTVDFTYIVVKPEEPEEEPEQEPEAYDYEYTFGGKGDTQPIGMILAANELFLDSYTAAAEDDTLVTMDEDLNVTAVKFFDATVLTVTDDAGTEYRILLHNPAPAVVELADEEVAATPYDETETFRLVEKYGLGIETGEGDRTVGYAAFDIFMADVIPSDESEYIVPVTLETPIELPAKEGMQNKVTYDLFHITDNGAEKVEILSVSDNNGAGPIAAFTFRTDSFSDYVLRYTVDFYYTGVYSIEGGSQILLSELIRILHITVPAVDEDSQNDLLLDVADVAEVHFTDEHLVDVQRVSGLITYNGHENVNVGDKDFLLSSLQPFCTDEVLTIVLLDGTEILVGVTDAVNALTINTSLYNFDDEGPIQIPANIATDNIFLVAWVGDSSDITQATAGTPWKVVDLNALKGANSPYSVSIDTFNTNPDYADGSLPYQNLSSAQKGGIKVRLIHTTKSLGELSFNSFKNKFWDETTFLKVWNGGFDGYEMSKTHPSGLTGSDNYEINLKQANTKAQDVVFEFEPASEVGAIPQGSYVLLKALKYQGNAENDQDYYTYVLPINIDGNNAKVVLPVEGNWSDGQPFSENWTNLSASIIKPRDGRTLTPGGNKPQPTDYEAVYVLGDYNYSYVGQVSETIGHVDHQEFKFILTKAKYERAKTAEEIVGPGYDFGITANIFHHNGHIQSNFAANDYYGEDGAIEPNLSFDEENNKVGGFIFAADIKDGRMYLNGNSPSDPTTIMFLDPSDTDIPRASGSGGNYLVVPVPGTTISSTIVNPILSHGEAMSAALLSHDPTCDPEVREEKINLTGFPDNTTIYLDGDKLANYIESGLTVKTNPGQVVVFNYDSTSDIGITQVKMNVNGTDINDIDYLSSHLVFNCNSASLVRPGGNACGMFLVPNPNSTVTISRGSANGWLIAGGDVNQIEFGAEWHLQSKHMRKVGNTSTLFSKLVDNNYPEEYEVFEFKLEKWNVNDEESYQNDSDWTELTPVLTNVGPTIVRQVEWKDGRLFRVSEIGKAETTEGNYTRDTKEYYIVIRYIGSPTLALATFPEYYDNFEDAYAVYKNQPADNGPGPNSIPGIVFKNETQKDQLSIKKVVRGTKKKDVEFPFDLYLWRSGVVTNESTGEEETIYSGYSDQINAALNNQPIILTPEESQYIEEDSNLPHVAGLVHFNLTADSDLILENVKDGTHYAFVENVNSPDMPAGYSPLHTAITGIAGEDAVNEIEFLNTYIAYYCVAVTKAWEDDNNRDGVRPDKILVELHQVAHKIDNTEEDIILASGIELNPANNWTYMKRGVPSASEDGSEFTYYWKEYKLTDEAADDTAENRTYPDEENRISFLTLEDGRDGTYSWSEEVTQKEESADFDELQVITTFTNEHESEKVNVKVTKVWEGDYAAEDTGKRELYGLRDDLAFRIQGSYEAPVLDEEGNPIVEDGKEKTETKYLTDTNEINHVLTLAKETYVNNINKTTITKEAYEALDDSEKTNYTLLDYVEWTDLPKYCEGCLITYTVVEEGIPTGYTAQIGDMEFDETSKTYSATVINTLQTGALRLNKNMFIDNAQVSSSDSNNWNRDFYVAIEYTDANNITWYVTPNGLVKKENNLAANIQTIKPSDTDKMYTGLPVGDYVIKEYLRNGEAGNYTYTEITSETTSAANIGSMAFVNAISKYNDTVTVDTEYVASNNDTIADATLVNSYTTGKYCIAVTKQWLVNGEVSVPDPTTEVYVKLQRTTKGSDAADADWENVTGIYMGTSVVGGNAAGDAGNNVIKLSKANNWSAVAVGMDQMDANGQRYSYRWVELKSINVNEVLKVGDTFQFGQETDARYIVGKPATVQKKTITSGEGSAAVTTDLIFLTELKNSRVDVEIPVKKTVNGEFNLNTEFTVRIVAGTSNPVGLTSEIQTPANLKLHKDDIGKFQITGLAEAGTYVYEITEEDVTSIDGLVCDTVTKTVEVNVNWHDTDAKDYLEVKSLRWKNKGQEPEDTWKVIKSSDSTVTADSENVEIVNTYTLASLKVTKQVKLDGSDNVKDTRLTGKTFYVSVSKDGKYYATTGAVVNDDDQWVEIKDGQSVIWNNLPVGTYTVTERNDNGENNVDGYIIATGSPSIVTNPAVITTASKGDNVVTVTVTNEYTTEKTIVAATKVWAGDGQVKDITRKNITLTLTGTYEGGTVTIPAMKEDGKTSQSAAQTIPSNADGTELTVKWDNLPVYVDGKKVSYTVSETSVPGYTTTYSEMTYNETTKKWEITVTNTLKKGVLKLYKLFSFDSEYYELTDEQKVNLKFTVTTLIGDKTYYVYKATAGSNAGSLDTAKHEFTYAQFTDGYLVIDDLPEGAYTVTESGADGLLKAVGYTLNKVKIDEIESAVTSEDADHTYVKQNAAVTNGEFIKVHYENHYTQDRKTIRARKVWEPADTPLKQDVTFTIEGSYQDNGTTKYITDTLIDRATKSLTVENANQYVEWTDLPAYHNGKPITYTVSEASIPGITTTYSALTNTESNVYELTVTNTVEKGKLNISKKVFVNNADKTSDNTSKEFYVKVKAVINGETYWVTGSSGELTKASASATIANAHKFTVYPGTDLTLNNIPVGTYTVYEVDADGNPITENTPETKLTTIGDNTYSALMSTTEATAEVAQGTTPAAAELVNHYTNGKYCIAVTKQWLVNGKVSVPDNQTLIVQLQRTTTPDNEASYEPALFNLDGSESTEKKNTVELNKGNNWSAVAIGMDQMNDAGQRYTYRWVEMNGTTPVYAGSQLDGWMVGKAETIQSATKDGTQLIFLTRLTNSKAEAEIPVKKVLKQGSTPYTGNARFKVALTKSNATTGTQSMGGTNGFTVTPDTPHEVEVGINDIEKYVLSNFNQPGNYVFTLTESAVNPVIGFTYDTTPRTVTVTVAWHNGATDNTQGDYLTATVKQGSSVVDAEHPVTFENEYNLGKLKVVKTFDFGSAVNKPTAAELARIQFKVTGYQNNAGEKGATIYDETTLYLVQMTRNGESYEWSAELDHLPFGIYTVTESLNGTVLDNFDYKETSITVDGSNQPVVAPTVDAPINKDTMDASTQEETVTLTNKYELKQGELQISKKVVNGLAADSTKQFDIEISVLGASVNGNTTEYEYYKPANAVTKASDKITFTGDKATVQLAKDESIRIVGLPAGAAYTVAEAAASREGFDVLVSPDQGNLGNGTAVAVTVTNTRKTADLSLTKTVDSTLWSDEQKEFNFTITFSEAMPDTVSVTNNGTFSVDRKAVTAKLKTGETVRLTKVPQGVTYTVSEVHADGFTESMTVNGTAETVTLAEGKAASGDIILTADAVIDFTNKKDTGKLAIHKTVQSALKQDETREFKFKVYLFMADGIAPSDPVDGTGTTHKLTFKGVLTRPGYNGSTLTREREIVFTTGESEEIVLKHDETMTIEGIPAGFKYYVVETPDADFSTASTNAGTDDATISIDKDETGTAQFTNTRKVLPLKLEKKVVSPIDEDSKTFYDFTVRLLEGSEVLTSSHTSTDSNYYSVKYYTSDGAEFTAVPAGYTLPEGVTSLPDHLALSDGETHVYVIAGGYTVLENLPKGVIYTVNENIDNTFAVETTNDGKGTLTAENTTVKTTNTRKTGNLVVSKTVNSNQDNDKNTDFQFVVELYETYNAETQTGTAANLGIPEGETKDYGGMTFQTVTEEGKTRTYAEFTLRGNSNPAESMKKAEGLPIGLKYVVTETDSHGMVQTSTGEIGEITGGNNEAKFTNTRAKGGLVVSKSVISELSSDKTKDFHFTLTLFNGTVDAEGNHTTRLPSQAIDVTIRGEGITTETTISTTTDADGQYSFDLKDGQIAVFSTIPIGAYFTVEEQNDAGFTTTKRGDVGTIHNDAANLAEFVNTAKPGELKIQKTVVSPIAADRTKTFKFNVKLFEPSDNTLTGDALTAEGNRSYLSATIAGRYFDGTNGADFYVMGTQTLTLDNIPAGVYYEVTEVLDDARFHSEAVTPVTGKIQTLNAEKSNFSLVHYKNTRTDATLILEKNVVSTVESDKNIDFTYTIVFNESITGEFEVVTNGTGTVGGASYTANGTAEGVIQINAGRATVTLRDGAKMTVKGLPIGTEFTIVEAVNNSFDAAVYNKTSNSYEETNEFHSTVDDKNVPKAIFRNTRKTGSLSLTKMVSSSMSSDAEKPFTFNVIFDRELDNTGNTMKVAVDGTDTTFTLAKESKTEDGTTTTVSAIRGIKLEHQQTAVISGLPAGVTYTITEDEANQGGFVTTSTGETGTISAYVSRATFTNTKQVGGLIVSKAVDSTVAADKADTKKFHYTVTITDPAPADLGITAGQSRQFGVMTFELKDGKAVAEFDLSDGGSTYATDLPEGTKYTIVETNDENMTIRTAVASVSDRGVGTVNTYTGNPPEGIIHTGTTASVAYTNIRKTANLQIEKEVQSDNPADQGKSFQFKVTLMVNNLALPGTFGGYSFDAEGKCTITLHGGDKAVLTDLPVGTAYTIVETEASANGFTTNPSDRTISGTLAASDEGKTIAAKFTNTRDTGKLIIEKKVESSLSADNTRDYEVKLYLDAEIGTESVPKTYSGISFVNGVATIPLNSGNGYKKTIEGLPVGVKYSVAETPVEGMSVSYTHQTGTIAKTADGITVTVTNTRKNKQLEIDKKVFVNDEDKTGTYSDRIFYVKVMARIGGETYWVTDANGALTKQPATGTVNPWIFSITPGTTTKLDSMPEGEYTVFEVTQKTNGADSVDASHAPTANMGGMLFVAALSQTSDTVNLSGQNGTAHIVNKYTSEKFCVAVTKNWVDDGNKYGTRPDDLTVTLQRYVLNGTDKIFDTTVFGTKSYTLTADNNWTYLVTGVDQFDAQGREYHYVWAEETLARYAEGAQQEKQVGTYARTEDPLVLITKLNNSLVNADIPVRKIITGDTYTGDEQFEIKLVFVSAKDAEDHDITAPEVIPSGASLSLRENESGIFTLKGIRTPGTYTYKILETDKQTAGMTYAAYQTVTIEVGWNSDTAAEQTHLVVKSIQAEGKDVSATAPVTIENRYERGKLIITKTFSFGNDPEPADFDKSKLTFTISSTDVTGFTPVTVNLGNFKYDAGTKIYSYELKDLVLGKYAVSEAGAEGLISNYTLTANGSTSSPVYVTLSRNDGNNANGNEAEKTAAFVNTYTQDKGSLKIKKSISGATLGDLTEAQQKAITFTVTGPNNYTKSFSLFDMGEDLEYIIPDLPIGEYTVTESGADRNVPEGFNYSSTVYSVEDGRQTTVKNEVREVTVTNSYTEKTGELEISKTVISPVAADQEKEFEFTITLTPQVSGDFSGVEFENGTATITLHGRETRIIRGLPSRTVYTVEETATTGFTNTEKTGETGTISQTRASAAFTNTRDQGNLIISKTVISPIPAEMTAEYSFDILLNEKVNGTFGDVTFTDGKASGIMIRGGESKTIEGLPTGVTYTVTEAEYRTFITTSTGASGTITKEPSEAKFTNDRKTGELEISKTVRSSSAADAEKSFRFTVTLGDTTVGGTEGEAFGDLTFRNGVAEFTLKDGEKATASGLPTGVSYTVEEEKTEGFVTTSAGETGTICLAKSIAAFTNTKAEGGLVVSKKVISAVEADHETEFDVTVTLDDPSIGGEEGEAYGDATFINGAAALKLKDGDTAVITGLPAGVGYKVKETLTDEDAEAFTIAYNGKTSAKEAEGTIREDKTASAKVTNIRKTAELTITKKVVSNVAADRNGEAFLFTVELTHGGKAVDGVFSGVTFENGIAQIWLKHGEKAALKGLPYGTEYSVQEATPDRFTKTVEGGETGTLTEGKTIVAYTNTAEYVEKTVKKVWEDNSDSYGKRPKSVSATLKANGEVLKTVILNKENQWTWTETKLPRYSKGREILYAWEETDVPDGYVMESEAKGNVTTITNTFLTGKLKITKTFSDNVADNPAVKKLTFTIVGPGLNKTVEYSEFRKGEYLLENLIPGVYAVVENNAYGLVSGYTLKAADSVISANGIVTAETDLTLALKNVYEEEKKPEEPPTPGPGPGPGPQTGTIVIRKVFTGMTELDDPGNLTFRILGPDGYDERVPYSQFTDGAYTISGLKPGQYLVYEMNAAVLNTAWKLLETSVTTAGGEVAVGQETVFELQNDYEVPTTSTGVMKVWDDMDNLDGSRPANLSVALLQDGRVIRHAALSEGNGWKAEITGLPLFNAAGAVIQYSWREEEVPGYVLSSQIRLGNATVMKNTHKPEVTSVSVTKIWDDNRNEAGLRPASLRVRLSNGTNYTLNEANGWTVTVENLPKYVNGEEVRYTWSEQSVLGYTLTDVRTVGDTTIFTNSYRMPLPPTEDGTPNTGTRLHILEDYGTPLGIEILINHVGDCYE